MIGGDDVPVAPLEPPRPSRRSHPKSRTGCKTCKGRKIKILEHYPSQPHHAVCSSSIGSLCDEQRPRCGNCKKHGVVCDFVHSASTATPSRVGSPSTELNSAGTPLPPSVGGGGLGGVVGGELQMVDLELMYNFTTYTCSTLSPDPLMRDFWKVNVVQLALQCPYVMRALLSVSGLHIAYFRPDRREFYIAQAVGHHEKASKAAMALLSGQVTPEIGRNLYLFSVLTIYYAVGSPRKSDDDDIILLGASETAIPDWLFLLRGTMHIIKLLGEEVFDGPLAPMFVHGRRRYEAIFLDEHPAPSAGQDAAAAAAASQGSRSLGSTPSAGPGPASASTPRAGWNSINNGPSPPSGGGCGGASSGGGPSQPSGAELTPASTMEASLHRQRQQADLRELEERVRRRVAQEEEAADEASLPAEERGKAMRVYTHAIEELRKSFRMFFSARGMDLGDAMMWLFVVADDFLPFLKVPTQEALVIFAHFSVLLKRLDNQWWLQGWGSRLIVRIHAMLDQEHRLWIQWPIEEAGIIIGKGL